MIDIREWLDPAFTELDRRALQRHVASLLREIEEQPAYQVLHLPGFPEESVEALTLVYRLMHVVYKSDDRKKELDTYFMVLTDRLATTSKPAEHDAILIQFLAALDPDPRRLRGDVRALGRYLDYGAAEERYRKRILHEDILQKLALDAIGYVTAQVFTSVGLFLPGVNWRDVLSQLNLEPFLLDHAKRAGRWQNKVAAAAALRKIVVAVPVQRKLDVLDLETSLSISEYCLDKTENVWIQIEALRGLAILSPAEAMRVFSERLFNRDDRSENLFVRKAILELIGEQHATPDAMEMLRKFADDHDESDYVRVQLVRTLARFETPEAFDLIRAMLRGDVFEMCPQVRAEAVIAWASLAESAAYGNDDSALGRSQEVLAWAIKEADDPLVQHVAFEEAARVCNHRAEFFTKTEVDGFDKAMLDALQHVMSSATDLRLRRWAGEAWNAILVHLMPEYRELSQSLLPRIAKLREGESLRVRRSELPEDADRLGRILAYFSSSSFGLYVEQRGDNAVVVRGDRFHRSWWRVQHEARNLSPDKRQGFQHTVGRRYVGEWRAHTGVMGELTRTKVPGERLYIDSEGSWRRHIPLLDDYLSLCRRSLAGKEVRLYSSFGVTRIRGPRSFRERLSASWRLSRNYADVATLRNANPRDREHSDVKEYLDRLRHEYGMATSFAPYEYESAGARFRLTDDSLERPFQGGAQLRVRHKEALAGLRGLISEVSYALRSLRP